MVSFEDDGKIVFPKPHSVSKIEPVIVQAIKRRMNRWFKRYSESFARDK
jgi:hypothetical protein